MQAVQGEKIPGAVRSVAGSDWCDVSKSDIDSITVVFKASTPLQWLQVALETRILNVNTLLTLVPIPEVL